MIWQSRSETENCSQGCLLIKYNVCLIGHAVEGLHDPGFLLVRVGYYVIVIMRLS